MVKVFKFKSLVTLLKDLFHIAFLISRASKLRIVEFRLIIQYNIPIANHLSITYSSASLVVNTE
jgi:hypothetical protein